MNIFAVSNDVITNASTLDDKRLNKMIVETGQILCTVLNTKANYKITPYRSTHNNHPCVKWASNEHNWWWLYQQLIAYGIEYISRFNKTHRTFELLIKEENILKTFFRFNSYYMPYPPITHSEFVNCSYYKDTTTFDAYKKTLVDKWNTDKRPPKWTNRDLPEFYKGAA